MLQSAIGRILPFTAIIFITKLGHPERLDFSGTLEAYITIKSPEKHDLILHITETFLLPSGSKSVDFQLFYSLLI